MVQRERRVSRVLVMLEYGEGDPCNGEVFDLTALAHELAVKDEKHQHARIQLEVKSSTDYSASRQPDGKWPLKEEMNWDVSVAFNSSGSAGWLDDAVNASMRRMDTEGTERMMKAIRKQERRLEALRDDLKEMRLAAAASIRMLAPIGRITESPMKAIENGEEGVVL